MRQQNLALVALGLTCALWDAGSAKASQGPATPVAPSEMLELEVGAILIRRPVAPQDPDEPGENPPAHPRHIISRGAFDLFLFGSTARSNSGRLYMHRLLSQKIDELERSQPLTPDERRRLTLAGRGDIVRLFDRIEAERRTFESIRTSGDVDRCERFFASLLPLRRTLPRGPFGPDSLFAKTFKKVRAEG
jgi:hypothetical protein